MWDEEEKEATQQLGGQPKQTVDQLFVTYLFSNIQVPCVQKSVYRIYPNMKKTNSVDPDQRLQNLTTHPAVFQEHEVGVKMTLLKFPKYGKEKVSQYFG